MGPFLEAAIAEMLHDADVDRCHTCGFTWATEVAELRAELDAAAGRFAALLDTAPDVATDDGGGDDGEDGWTPSGYVWHVADVARAWAERLHALRHDPTAPWAGFDPDELGRARRYDELPACSGPWAVGLAVAAIDESLAHLDPGHRFDHPEWGGGTVADALRWVAHEVVHHQLDIERATTGSVDCG